MTVSIIKNKKMGIIIAPILLLTIVIGFFAIGDTAKLIKSRRIHFKDVMFGLLVSVTILFLIRANLESTYRYLTIMLYQSILPYALYTLLKGFPSKNIRYCAKILLINVSISTILYSITILLGESFI